jgi:hypothetical protein
MSLPTARGPLRHELLSWSDVDRLVDVLVPQIRTAGHFDTMLIITRGGIIPGGLLSEALDISYTLIAAVKFPLDIEQRSAQLAVMPTFLQFPDDELLRGRRVLTVDDVWGSGRTSTSVKNRCIAAGATPYSCVFHFNPYRSLFTRAEPDFYGAITDARIVYPWEVERGTDNILSAVPGVN